MTVKIMTQELHLEQKVNVGVQLYNWTKCPMTAAQTEGDRKLGDHHCHSLSAPLTCSCVTSDALASVCVCV